MVNSESCRDSQCSLFLHRNDLPSEFYAAASEKGVKIVYLYLKVDNETYHPAEPNGKFLPGRWTWAVDISEPILSFSYDYDILSLGVLQYQFRRMRVWLSEQPTGCLSNLSLSCQDLLLARVLLTELAKEFSQKKPPQDDVVCGAVVDKNMDLFLFLFEGNIVYRCCNSKTTGNQSLIECDLKVEVSQWLYFFYDMLNIVTIVVFFVWPTILLFLPDFFFSFEDKADPQPSEVWKEIKAQCEKTICCDVETEQSPLVDPDSSVKRYGSVGKSNEGKNDSTTENEATEKSPKEHQAFVGKNTELIPVNDTSPISLTRLIRYCTSISPLFTSDCSKLFLLYYILFPIVYYYKLVLSFLFKDHHLREEIKIPGARLEGAVFAWFFGTVYFDLDLRIVCPVVIVLICCPGVIIFYVKPYHIQNECSVCGSNPFSLREDIREHLTLMANFIFSGAKYFLTGGCFSESFKSRKVSLLSDHFFRPLTRQCFGRLGRWILCCKCSRECVLLRSFLSFPMALFVITVFFILFLSLWGAILGILVTSYLFLFTLTVLFLLLWDLPYFRFLIFAWRVLRQSVYGEHLNKESDEPPKTIPCFSCTYGRSYLSTCCPWCHSQVRLYLSTVFSRPSKDPQLTPDMECTGKETKRKDKTLRKAGSSQENESVAMECIGKEGEEGAEKIEDRNAESNENKSYKESALKRAKRLIGELILMLLALCGASGISIVAGLSCRFAVRLIGFFIVGMVLNAERTTPFITFTYVLINHIFCYYTNFQTRYTEIKKMILKRWNEKSTLLPNTSQTDEDTIPLHLFWFVCNECRVLPLVNESVLMLVNIIFFTWILLVALAAVVFFGEEYNRSPLVSAAAVLISGKLPEWLFKKLIKGRNFTDKELLEKKKKVSKAVDDFVLLAEYKVRQGYKLCEMV